MLTLKSYLTSSGKYPEREKLATKEIIANAIDLIARVNALLEDIGHTEVVEVSSGFRPADANKAAGGATKSGHLRGLAVDIFDPRQQLSKMLQDMPGALYLHGLMMEDPNSTKTWLHVDTVPRKARTSQVFKP